MKKEVEYRLRDIIEQNEDIVDIIEMIDKEFCIKAIPYFKKRIF